MKIAMLLSNPFRPDPRVFKEAKSLTEAGYHVSIICWDRKKEYPRREKNAGIEIIRVQSVASTYGAGAKQILSLPRFWQAALSYLDDLQPDVLHCHDLDTLPIGWRYSRKNPAKLIYDAHEDYPSLMSLYLPKFMVAGLGRLEALLTKDVDIIITASTMLESKFKREGRYRATTIGNYPDLTPFDKLSHADFLEVRSQLNIPERQLLVAYIGGFSRNRMLKYMIGAAKSLADVHFAFWGDGHQRDIVEAADESMSNVQYFGWLPYEKVPLYTSLADIIYYVINPDYPGAIYNAPNAMGNAMAAGSPIIANDLGDLGRIVKETNAGILLETLTTESIIAAIQMYRDPLLREQIGLNGKQAARSYYNWNRMEDKLIGLYTEIMNN